MQSRQNAYSFFFYDKYVQETDTVKVPEYDA